ncbi:MULTISPECIES: YggS family pyridoxal phosphate-dependent enzyme [unclassified Lactococcus]|uniref:YggS family pyridoxal phosphate-dependent enzyme n=1 Tax=unclassified Lactococcus TaxID=2643510 RepID=UPI0011C78CE5|nr:MULTISPECIES: YggS family pyridoxal phosphate-dependent enzyme [unclassified Lactococcus]MQW23749.1 YggS family pyridoxal phosphate-dependent enzyme [Lactococcus sp. dk101]TXK37456.1 YggS family pyridoxal phosphate-dependent enzyme [Lactococcus sp. dk310]TXK48799.1 YggS family pyridoxal phosphate-dependent enzyme [Lactococcus sp. dk322]
MTIAENVKRIKDNVENAINLSDFSNQKVSILAVTKYGDANLARQIVQAGIQNIAENRTELFLDKYNQLKDLELTWHLIGSLQRRKVKEVINCVDYFHALDSLKLAQEIEKRADHKIKCFLQVNISGEESKHGFTKTELMDILSEFAQFTKIEIVGLMTMAPLEATDEECASIFHDLKQVQVEISEMNLENVPCTELSMGMSRDYQIAIKEGATFVRIGHDFLRDVDLSKE